MSVVGAAAPPSRAAVWLQALRLYALSASVIPVALGFALAWPARDGRGIVLWLPALVGAILLHLGTNLVNDLGDFQSAVDRLGVSEGSGVLTRGLLGEAQVGRAAAACFGLAVLCGLPLVLARGWPMLALGIAGALGGWAYTAGPRYKYLGLGDPAVFLLMGPLMSIGAYLSVSGRLAPAAALASIPVGLLVVAILHANNLRDLDADAQARIRTVAQWLGLRGSLLYFAALVLGAYLALLALVAARVLPAAALIALVTAFPAARLLRSVARAGTAEARRALQPVEATAKLHLLFGGLVVLGVVGSRFFHP